MSQGRRRCQARTKTGSPCGAAPTKGGRRCFFHTNPKKASELGRIGGRSKGWAPVENADSLPTLDNVIAVRDSLARVIPDLLTGTLNPRVAPGLAALLNVQMRAIETASVQRTTALEQRVAKLEKLLSEAASEKRVDGDEDPEPPDPDDPDEPIKP
jgi:hypothetical protein